MTPHKNGALKNGTPPPNLHQLHPLDLAQKLLGRCRGVPGLDDLLTAAAQALTEQAAEIDRLRELLRGKGEQ